MSNIIDINDLKKQFQEKLSIEEWQSFAKAQFDLIDQYQKELVYLKDKNKHLESLLFNKTSEFATELTPEEVICIQQISRLEKLSNERQLTLEEVKRLDLLVKNLKLIREESTIVVNNKKVDNLKEAELVAIVRASESNSGDSERS